MCVISITFILKGMMTYKIKSPWFLMNKTITFYKNKIESKMENPMHINEMNPCASAGIRIANKK